MRAPQNAGLTQEQLRQLYLTEKLSMAEIAERLNFSVHKVAYWMEAYGITRRSISEAIYQKHNPNGDPFLVKRPVTVNEHELFGMGLGLYWGEGNKANLYAVRLGNTDPKLLTTFMRFLTELFGVDPNDFRFMLQIFTDINPQEALDYWVKELQVSPAQFYKTHVTISGSIGTYKKKSLYGVVTVHYHNKKLRDILVGMLPR